MDLLQTLRVLWKRKWLLLIGTLVGILLAFLSLYKVYISFSPASFRYEPRSYTTYETSITLLLDEPGFGYGNLNSGLSRAIALGKTYPALITSSVIQEEVKNKLGSVRGTVTVSAAENAPIVNIKVQGLEPKHIQNVAKTTADVFIDYIRTKQKENKTPRRDRILIHKLGPPSLPVPLISRKWETAFLTFLAALIATAAVAFILENLEQSKFGPSENKLIAEKVIPNPGEKEEKDEGGSSY